MLPFRKILWVKSVSLEEGELAYAGRDPSVRAREPRHPGDLFELHASPEDADSLGDPAVGDLVVLTQHDQVTHLVRAVGEGVEARPRRTMRKGTRDERFSEQRTFALVLLRGFEEAPWLVDAFGFDPAATGGGRRSGSRSCPPSWAPASPFGWCSGASPRRWRARPPSSCT